MEVRRFLHLLKAGLRLWREEGAFGLVRRYKLRHGPVVPHVSRLGVFLGSLRPLRMPDSKNPDVSIIVPAHPTRRSLMTIIRNSRGTNYEIVHDATEAKGRFLLYLDNDHLPARGALEAMLDVITRRPECDAVAAKVLRPNGTLKAKGDDPDLPRYNYVCEVDFGSGAVMVRRETSPESDIRVWYQPAAHVYEFGKSEEQVVIRARNRRIEPAILVIDHQVPMPDRDAGSLFMTRFLQTAAASGHHVVFWPDNLLRGRYGAALQQNGVEVLYGSLSFEHFIATYGRPFSFAVVYRSSMASKYIPALERAGIPTGYIAVDLEHVREARRTHDEQLAGALKERERTIVQTARCVGVHSPVEADILRRELSAEHVIELPLPLTRARSDSPGMDRRSGLLFLGSTHQPNVDAIRHFAERIFPRIRERSGDVPLNIAGNVSAAVRDLGRLRSIRLLGHVNDLASCFDESRVFVAPMQFGAGIKGKILEAMNHGIPVVTTPVGAEGIGLIHGEMAMIAENDDAFVEHVVELYSNAELWQKIQLAGRAFVQQRQSETSFIDAVDRFLTCLRQH